MAGPKTIPTKISVKNFLSSIENESVRNDCNAIADLMAKVTGAKPKMWGENIIGFGNSKLKYADGSEREWMKLAFSPRKKNITLYLPIFAARKDLEAKLGKYVSTKACVHFKKLSDLHIPTLNKLLKESAKQDDCGCKT